MITIPVPLFLFLMICTIGLCISVLVGFIADYHYNKKQKQYEKEYGDEEWGDDF